jgi:hypothetical protein
VRPNDTIFKPLFRPFTTDDDELIAAWMNRIGNADRRTTKSGTGRFDDIVRLPIKHRGDWPLIGAQNGRFPARVELPPTEASLAVKAERRGHKADRWCLTLSRPFPHAVRRSTGSESMWKSEAENYGAFEY